MYFFPSTPTQAAFLCCLYVFGPMFGFWTAFKHKDSRFSPWFSFIFGAYCAYAGWFLSGMTAMVLFPDYPVNGPAEVIAISFILPGFLTGLIGVYYHPKDHGADISPINAE